MPTGTLYVVATPIGNLEDMTPRGARILREVDLIACEDTRHTKKLLTHLGITTPLTSCYREKERAASAFLLGHLREGKNIALVSDAGTPGLSDPGSILVAEARAAQIPVVPVPGVSALGAALSVAGLKETPFFFGGFPPARKGERRSFLKNLATLPWPLFFYESPHRIRHTLRDCLEVFGERQAMIFRELTKLHEEHLSGTIPDLLQSLTSPVRGEIVLLIHPAPVARNKKPDNLPDLIRWHRDQGGLTLKDTVRTISRDLDLPRNMVYQEALKIWKAES
ncbi:MAG: 16S rRNA (cytidine(1402)-2'-O)-methyltransferase [Desulfobulbaceae bacterium]